MVGKQKTTYYLDPDVVAGMKMLAATVGQTESGIVEEAVRSHLRAQLDTLRPQLEDLFARLSAKGHRLSDQDAWELASRGVKETRALREASTSRSKRPQAVEGGVAQPTESLEPAEAVSGAQALDQGLTGANDLKTAIQQRRELPEILQALAAARVLTLGRTVPNDPESSDLLHFEPTDDGNSEEDVPSRLPVFTRVEILVAALKRNEDWQELMVLSVHGASLLDNVEDDVSIVIDPWSNLEFQVPPRRSRLSGKLTAYTPIVRAEELVSA